MVAPAPKEGTEQRIANMVRPKRATDPKYSCVESSGDENRNDESTIEDIVHGDTEERKVENEGEENDKDEESDDSDNDQSYVNNDEENFQVSSTRKSSSQNSAADARSTETSISSSDSNKENIDSSNTNCRNLIEFDPSDYVVIGEYALGEYDNTDQIPLPQLLKMHVKQLVSGFEFGEATKRRAQENMKTAREKQKSESRKSGDMSSTNVEKESESASDLNQPSCSKEVEHKTPHSRKRQRLAESKMIALSTERDFSKATRRVPDCLLDHPDCIEVWVYMIYKEEASLKLRNSRLFNDFKSVTPRMRAILLDWLMEVASVYHLRRVTYYLSVDYFDRFLSIRPDIPKSLLQLVGITCLYIAAKVEEIYPPNLSEFSYVCDGACKSKEMVSCELLILNSLGWEVVLTTPSDWLNLYMQLHFKSQDIVRTHLNMDFNKDFIFPQYSAYQFTRASQLMDLLSLDPGFLKFGYSVIAAAAMYYMYGQQIALSVSGLSWQQLKPCVDYMEVFYTIIKDAPDPRLHSCLGGPHPDEMNRFSAGLLKRIHSGPTSENYSFQTHVASMDYFEKATIYRLTNFTGQNSSDIVSSSENSQDFVKSEGAVDSGCQPSSTVTSETEENGGNENKQEERNTDSGEESLSPSLVEDLKHLDEFTKSEDSANSEHDQNLMSLDEIFELILSQDELTNNSE